MKTKAAAVLLMLAAALLASRAIDYRQFSLLPVDAFTLLVGYGIAYGRRP